MKKYIICILVAACYLSMTCRSFASNPYQDAHGQGYSEYETPSGNKSSGTSNSGVSSSGTSYPGTTPSPPLTSGDQGLRQHRSQGSGGWNMPGNGTSPSSHATSSGGSGYSGGSSSGSHEITFDASIGSDGSLTLSLPNATDTSAVSTAGAASLVVSKYKNIGTIILAVCIITAIISLLFQITKLGASGDNQMMRSGALKGIFFSGAALALFG